MQRTRKSIKVKLYNCNIDFILAKNAYSVIYNEFKKYDQLHRWDEEGPKDNNFSGYALDMTLDNYDIIFNLMYPIDHNTISHEIHHLVGYIFDQRGIIENKNHEAACWLAGYLAHEVYKFLNERNIQVI